jgi:hypothetical protein
MVNGELFVQPLIPGCTLLRRRSPTRAEALPVGRLTPLEQGDELRYSQQKSKKQRTSSTDQLAAPSKDTRVVGCTLASSDDQIAPSSPSHSERSNPSTELNEPSSPSDDDLCEAIEAAQAEIVHDGVCDWLDSLAGH